MTLRWLLSARQRPNFSDNSRSPRLHGGAMRFIGGGMSIPPPEVITVDTARVACDGATAIRGGANYRPAALGHPKVYLEIDEHGYVDCGYCDRRFVLRGGPADGADQASLPDISEGGDPGHR